MLRSLAGATSLCSSGLMCQVVSPPPPPSVLEMGGSTREGKTEVAFEELLAVREGKETLLAQISKTEQRLRRPFATSPHVSSARELFAGAPSSPVLTIKAMAFSALFPSRGRPLSSNVWSYLHCLSLPSCVANGQSRHHSESSLRYPN